MRCWAPSGQKSEGNNCAAGAAAVAAMCCGLRRLVAHARPPATRRHGSTERDSAGNKSGKEFTTGQGGSPRVLFAAQRRVLPKGMLVQSVPLAAGGRVFRAADLRKRLWGAVLLVPGSLKEVALREAMGMGDSKGA